MLRTASQLIESGLRGHHVTYDGDPSIGFAFCAEPDEGWRPGNGMSTARIPLSASDSRLMSAKILVVDDEPFNVKMCQKYLNELGYHQSIGLVDSTQVFDVILKERPELVILDVMMPLVSGVDILKWARVCSDLKDLPILILTASSDRTTKQCVMELGATDFLTKPIDPSELALRIRNVLLVKKYHDSILHQSVKAC